jgi:3-hydroxyacyl-[acyl-carrier-protein] dehydratase
MLINDFYTCHDIEEADLQFSCRIAFNEKHAIFGGHFPGNPVVPGVCMMEIVKELLEKQVNEPLILRSAGNVKFLQLITPGMQPVINISWKKSEAGYSVNASFNSGASILFKLNGAYELLSY